MKKLIAMFGITALLASCSSEELATETAAEPQSDITVVQVLDGKIVSTSRGNNATIPTLAFADQQSYNNFKNDLEGMSKDERIALMHSYGVSNLYDLATIADEELEEFGTKATSEDDFRIKYNQYVEKYKGLLVTNPNDDTDLQLYVPDKENVETFIANLDGQYVIGGDLIKADFDLRYSESMAVQPMAASDEVGDFVNSGTFEPASGKRVEFSIGRKYDTVHITAKFKKHMWYGWKHDPNHEIMFDLALSGAAINWIAAPASRIWIKTKDDFDMDMFQITDNGVLSGMIYIWTDYSFERDSNGEIIYIIDGNTKYPKVLTSKAVKCKVSLPRPI